MRGVRGAITVEEDRKEAIWSAAATLVETMLRENGIARLSLRGRARARGRL